MSRSRKKNPITKSSRNQKKWRIERNRAIRRNAKDEELEHAPPKYYRFYMNLWSSPMDGCRYWDKEKGYRK